MTSSAVELLNLLMLAERIVDAVERRHPHLCSTLTGQRRPMAAVSMRTCQSALPTCNITLVLTIFLAWLACPVPRSFTAINEPHAFTTLLPVKLQKSTPWLVNIGLTRVSTGIWACRSLLQMPDMRPLQRLLPAIGTRGWYKGRGRSKSIIVDPFAAA